MGHLLSRWGVERGRAAARRCWSTLVVFFAYVPHLAFHVLRCLQPATSPAFDFCQFAGAHVLLHAVPRCLQPAASQAFDFLGGALLAEVLAALEESLPGE